MRARHGSAAWPGVLACLVPAVAAAGPELVADRVIVVGRVDDGAWSDAATEGPTDLDDHGMPASPITGVHEGELIRIDYGGALRHHTPRDWDHVAALWEDRSDPDGPLHGGPDGRLDGFDLVIHMGHPRLLIEPLARQAPATIDVLRFRQK